MSNHVVWTAAAVDELDAAMLNGPLDACVLVNMLEARQLLPSGWDDPDEDEIKVLYAHGLRAVYHLVGAGTTIEVLEVGAEF
ncbi:hypothetical protein [Kribbella sp. NPDC051770]|uniref:hypothetical protein n=1 Tax=Kribbella sp. NPDC051770 TaxID=3155413 RepID=UPI00343B25A6